MSGWRGRFLKVDGEWWRYRGRDIEEGLAERLVTVPSH